MRQSTETREVEMAPTHIHSIDIKIQKEKKVPTPLPPEYLAENTSISVKKYTTKTPIEPYMIPLLIEKPKWSQIEVKVSQPERRPRKEIIPFELY